MVMWYYSADTLFWQVLVDHNMDVGQARSTCGSQKLGVLPKQHENSLFLRR